MKNGLIICLHRASVVRVFHQMSDETGNSDSERFGVDDRNFFDDPLVGVKIEGQFGVVSVDRKTNRSNSLGWV